MAHFPGWKFVPPPFRRRKDRLAYFTIYKPVPYSSNLSDFATLARAEFFLFFIPLMLYVCSLARETPFDTFLRAISLVHAWGG